MCKEMVPQKGGTDPAKDDPYCGINLPGNPCDFYGAPAICVKYRKPDHVRSFLDQNLFDKPQSPVYTVPVQYLAIVMVFLQDRAHIIKPNRRHTHIFFTKPLFETIGVYEQDFHILRPLSLTPVPSSGATGRAGHTKITEVYRVSSFPA